MATPCQIWAFIRGATLASRGQAYVSLLKLDVPGNGWFAVGAGISGVPSTTGFSWVPCMSGGYSSAFGTGSVDVAGSWDGGADVVDGWGGGAGGVDGAGTLVDGAGTAGVVGIRGGVAGGADVVNCGDGVICGGEEGAGGDAVVVWGAEGCGGLGRSPADCRCFLTASWMRAFKSSCGAAADEWGKGSMLALSAADMFFFLFPGASSGGDSLLEGPRLLPLGKPQGRPCCAVSEKKN